MLIRVTAFLSCVHVLCSLVGQLSSLPCVPLTNKSHHGKADKSEDESSRWKVELGEFTGSVEILRTLDILMNMVKKIQLFCQIEQLIRDIQS